MNSILTKNRFGLLLIFVFLLSLLGCDPSTNDVPAEPPPVAVREAVHENNAEPHSAPVEIAPKEDKHSPEQYSPALTAFLPKFDALSAKGFVPTLRKGSTGIGYTLETMLNIEENNSPRGDFMGMELKAWRNDGSHSQRHEKMNLFLKEPKWMDGLSSKDRVHKYGYVDPNGRTALYSTVTIETNSHKLGFEIDQENSKLWMTFEGKRVAWWSFDVLEKRLTEKHTETVFVSADVQGEGKQEAFHYQQVLWCREPSVEKFLTLLTEGDVMLELRMHLKETGSVRNHGSCFRIDKARLKDLFRHSTIVRDKKRSRNEK